MLKTWPCWHFHVNCIIIISWLIWVYKVKDDMVYVKVLMWCLYSPIWMLSCYGWKYFSLNVDMWWWRTKKSPYRMMLYLVLVDLVVLLELHWINDMMNDVSWFGRFKSLFLIHKSFLNVISWLGRLSHLCYE